MINKQLQEMNKSHTELKEIYLQLFEIMNDSLKKIEEYLDKAKNDIINKADSYTKKMIEFQKIIIKFILGSYLNSNEENILFIGKKVSELYIQCSFQEQYLEVLTETMKANIEELLTKISKMENEDLKIFEDSEIIPFEGFPMKKEFILQVFIDAYSNKNESESGKYSKIIKMTLFKDKSKILMKLKEFILSFDNQLEEKLYLKYAKGNS